MPSPDRCHTDVFGATPLYWFTRLISPLITLGDWVAKATRGLFGIDSVHWILPDLAEAHLDVDRLRAETTRENWPVIGMLPVTRVDGETVDVRVEWVPR